MYHKIREAQQGDREEGFTLIELLVVVIIIGILAAIAIPVFLNQRTKARNASANSDLRNMITAQEAYYTEADVYANTFTQLKAANTGVTESSGVHKCTVQGATSDTFKAETKHKDSDLYYYYDSAVGQINKDKTDPAYCSQSLAGN